MEERELGSYAEKYAEAMRYPEMLSGDTTGSI
jgi:hypothetical protein